MKRLVFNADLGDTTISRRINGDFTEHLGRCIGGGAWPEEDAAATPNLRGVRIGIVDALPASKSPCCAGQAAVSPMSTGWPPHPV